MRHSSKVKIAGSSPAEGTSKKKKFLIVDFMNSPLKINPNTLLIIVSILLIFVLPIMLLLMGVKLNGEYYGIFIGVGLVAFFFFIYPRISKNKEFLAQEEESKEAGKTARQFPDFFKVRIVAGITLFLMLIISVYFYMIKKLWYMEFVAPVLVFSMMMYYANFLKKHKETVIYGEKLANIEQSGFNTFAKSSVIRGIIYIVGVITLAIFFLYLYLQK